MHEKIYFWLLINWKVKVSSLSTVVYSSYVAYQGCTQLPNYDRNSKESDEFEYKQIIKLHAFPTFSVRKFKEAHLFRFNIHEGSIKRKKKKTIT